MFLAMEAISVLDYIKSVLHIEDELLCKKVAELARVETYKKDETIIHRGRKQAHIRFLISGVVRFYYLDELQTEHTQCFVCEPGYPVMVDAYAGDVLSGCDAVNQVTVLALPMKEGFELVGSCIPMMNVYINYIRKAMLFHAEIAMVLRACDAHRRYLWFVRNFPEVEACAKSRHIASFLSISPETLSRVRAKQHGTEPYYGQMRLNGDERDFIEIRSEIWKDFPGGVTLENIFAQNSANWC